MLLLHYELAAVACGSASHQPQNHIGTYTAISP